MRPQNGPEFVGYISFSLFYDPLMRIRIKSILLRLRRPHVR